MCDPSKEYEHSEISTAKGNAIARSSVPVQSNPASLVTKSTPVKVAASINGPPIDTLSDDDPDGAVDIPVSSISNRDQVDSPFVLSKSLQDKVVSSADGPAFDTLADDDPRVVEDIIYTSNRDVIGLAIETLSDDDPFEDYSEFEFDEELLSCVPKAPPSPLAVPRNFDGLAMEPLSDDDPLEEEYWLLQHPWNYWPHAFGSSKNLLLYGSHKTWLLHESCSKTSLLHGSPKTWLRHGSSIIWLLHGSYKLWLLQRLLRYQKIQNPITLDETVTQCSIYNPRSSFSSVAGDGIWTSLLVPASCPIGSSLVSTLGALIFLHNSSTVTWSSIVPYFLSGFIYDEDFVNDLLQDR